jgi:hypothetical protein
MRGALLSLVGVALVFGGCSKSREVQSKAAIQEAIERHLQKQSNVLLNNMSVEVQDVRYEGDRANADVKFRSKQSPDLAVARQYVLRRVGDQWQVESSASPGGMGDPHGGATPAQSVSPSTAPVAPQASH